MNSWQHLADEGYAESVPAALRDEMFGKLIQLLKRRGLEVNDELREEMRQRSEAVRFKKEAVIFDYPGVRSHLIFNAGGVMCVENQYEGKNCPVGFLDENDVIVPFRRTSEQSPARRRFVALEDTNCITMRKEDIELLVSRKPEFARVMDKLFEHDFVRLVAWQDAIGLTASERYRWFCKRFPLIITRIPDASLALFLGAEVEALPDIKIV